ncbi:MAG: prepilin-type N-terminal cleavage/methylation domain-containing protein [Elusimicrobiaceae bacterium]|nr:prepilin-type N-terminal cleavage/methylation domain-containing protein [Elusimicrobiaceae bacterium]
MENRTGFTLIEVLVVVLIIAVLAAVAVPQYQKAVLKSRFSSLMPTTKAIRDGNEAYYMTHGGYASAVNQLDITATNNNDMTFELSRDPDYSYVLATRTDLNEKNNLVMYQKHSTQFPGETHCEALANDERANWLCEKGLHATQSLGEVISEGYNTYVLEGEGNGMSLTEKELQEFANLTGLDCSAVKEKGFSCTLDAEKRTKMICQNNVCVITEYNESGKKIKNTTCQLVDGICNSKKEYTYDENGNKASVRDCISVGSDGKCTEYKSNSGYDWKYDENGNVISERTCKTVRDDGTCQEYRSITDIERDASGNVIARKGCGGTNINEDGTCKVYTGITSYFYDEHGNKTKERSCSSINSETGTCASYYKASSSVDDYIYEYDTNGNMISEIRRKCTSITEEGECSSYGGGYDRTYKYDDDGNKIYSASISCTSVNSSNGTCTGYGTVANNNVYMTYDAQGNTTSNWKCSSVNSNGTCKTYSSGVDYIYDEEGRVSSQINCSKAGNATKKCQSGYGGRYDYSYDEAGNISVSYWCNSSKFGSDGRCTTYTKRRDYGYDTNGNQTSARSCAIGTDGKCTTYDSYDNYDYTYDASGNKISERTCGSVGSDGVCTSYKAGSDYTYNEDGKTSTKTCKTWSGLTCTEWKDTSYYLEYP